ncbi:glycosyltransferase family 4 protein [Gluconobacter wancherniae]|uniref:glycosyltransferase family 4 protein n=1 Tax=Gluconobacter wancherniae TaxID=1307955 RepID=UPI001B8C5A2D|nr:glycosyltransferase family 1 protein [Gluconobacter wancherniae]MBS1088294.1 glycosyltransferase family 4 protein [Gluconobacter wancherniae]
MTVFSSADAPFYTLDISRILSRANARVPTGIDRVELEYARYLCKHAPDRLEFAAAHPLRRFASLPFSKAQAFIKAIGTLWDSGAEDGGQAARLGNALLHGILLPRRHNSATEYAAGGRRSVYLLVSHHHLTRPELIAVAIRRRNSLFVPMVHDLIPLEFPEYARDREPPRHRRRIETVVRYADAVLVPSDATKRSLFPYFAQAGRKNVPIWPVPLGVHLRATASADSAMVSNHLALQRTHPYFVCLGTIEGRKNHLLLLNLWRRLIEIHGAATPHLVIVGKRGWENEQVIDMLERSPKLKGIVEEHNSLPDTVVTSLLRGAKGLLFPSFSEGFGLPLAEALALGTPVICSDIPVFHEIGRKTAIYLDPLDGSAWAHAIERLANLSRGNAPPTPIAPLETNQLLTWHQSISRALSHINTLVQKSPTS